VYARRQKLVAFLLLAHLSATAFATLAAQMSPVLRVGLITRANPTGGAASVARGVELGAAEAKQTASLLGGNVVLFEESALGSVDAAATRLLSGRKVQVIIGSSAEDANALSQFADEHGLIFFDAASRSTTLRSSCRRHTFHIEASDSMYANASRRGGARRDTDDSTVLWAGSLEKYGASQINERFRNRYHAPMDGSAWAGWVAVKIAAEAALRARSARTAALLSYLEAASTTFDGHKGWPLSFRSSDHQLRQPLYVVMRSGQTSGPGARDIPQLSSLSTAGTNANQLLDQLMPHAPACRRSRI
jgi:ABC-type branched-subunit amino acid transport system substrate-binding protein